MININFQPPLDTPERRIVADVGNPAVNFPVERNAHRISAVGQHRPPVADIEVGGRKAQLAPASIAVHHRRDIRKRATEQFIGGVQIAVGNQLPYPSAADGFFVDRDRRTNLRAEAVRVALANEHSTVALAESSEGVIRTRHHDRRRKFIFEQLKKFFGRSFRQLSSKRDVD